MPKLVRQLRSCSSSHLKFSTVRTRAGMLEVIESDFARLEADTKAAEASAQKEYDSFMTDSKVDKAAKTQDIEHKTAKKLDAPHAFTTEQQDMQSAGILDV